jgi:DnaJ-class molecular chaperone
MTKRVRKAWNGGSREAAIEYANARRDKMIEQGAALCYRCDGEGIVEGVVAGDTEYERRVCVDCGGAGVIVPPEGLRLSSDRP